MTRIFIAAAIYMVSCGLSMPISAMPDTSANTKSLIGKSITSREVLVYRNASNDTIVTAGTGDSHTVSTYTTFRGDTVRVVDDVAEGKRKLRIAFPGENGKEVAVLRRDTVVRKDEGNFRGSATYKTFRGDTILMEDVKTGEKRKLRIIFPGVDGKKVSVESETKVILVDPRRSPGESKTVSPRSQSPQSENDDRRNTPASGEESDDRYKRRKAIFGITLSRVDLGFTRPMSEGSFAMEGENEILEYRPGKTFNFGFDVFQMGYRFTPHFRAFLSGGFDWTYIRLKQGLEFDRNRSPYAGSTDLSADFAKNRLTSTYLRVPLTFEVKGARRNSMRLAFGPMAGFLLKGTQRYKLEDDKTRVKRRGDYGFAPFQYGVFARIGSKHLGVYGKYYFNDMFEDSPAGAGLRNFTFGLTAAF